MKTNATVFLIYIVGVHNTTTFHHLYLLHSISVPLTFSLKMSEHQIHLTWKCPMQNLYYQMPINFR